MQPSPTSREAQTQYLTFRVAAEEYAVDILRVQEIRGYSSITPIPNAPPYVKGVINLRGSVVPVLGMRERFGMPSVPYDKFTVIVVLSVGTKVVGVVVDAVTDVADVPQSDIDPRPDLGAEVDTSFVAGLAKVADRLLIILDVDRVAADAIGHVAEPVVH